MNKLISEVIVCNPLSSVWGEGEQGRGWGREPLPNFQKLGLDRISFFREGCWERRKSKKSKIFNGKKVYKQKM